MSNESLALPQALVTLQKKLVALRDEGKLLLQNGDQGFASAPSNIALLKYWGKAQGLRQVPVNSSLSFTLGSFRSRTRVEVKGRFFPKGEFAEIVPRFMLGLNSKPKAEVDEKMGTFLSHILSPFADDIGLRIDSVNNFPTACGIASSASGYAALVGALADLLQLEKHFTESELATWLFEWARLGSGSATRSALHGRSLPYVGWELVDANATTTTPLAAGHTLSSLCHWVLVVDAHEKSVSSSAGHRYAATSDLQKIRVASLGEKYAKIKRALFEDNFEVVKSLTEEDAFAMHAVMQTTERPVRYLSEDSLCAIETFLSERNAKNATAFWTADAGPNIHFLFTHAAKTFMEQTMRKLAAKLGRTVRCLENLSNEGLVLGSNAVEAASRDLEAHEFLP